MSTFFARDAEDCPFERGKHDKEARQRALVEAATSEFAENGFEATTTRAIADRAGCSEGLIHRYFGGKEGLLLAVLEHRAFAQEAQLEAAVPPSGDLEAEIHGLLQFALDAAWEKQAWMKVSVGRSLVDPAIASAVASRFHEGRTQAIQHRLERHRQAGHIAPGADLRSIAAAMSALGFATGFFGQVVYQLGRESVATTIRESARVIARGLAPAPVAPEEERP